MTTIDPTYSMIVTRHAARFWKYVSKGPECWMWVGAKTGGGYGSFSFGMESVQATHFSFYLSLARWPAPGMMILHSCDTPACVNPDHLKEGTQSQNLRESYQRNRRDKARMAQRMIDDAKKRTHCKNGHPYIDGFKHGRFRCKTCLINRGRLKRMQEAS